jgi:hypothetical protein
MKIKQMILAFCLVAVTAPVKAVDVKSPQDMLSGLGDIINSIPDIIRIVDSLKNVQKTFHALPPRIDAINTCLTYKSKSYPNWAAGKFDEKIDMPMIQRMATANKKDVSYIKNMLQNTAQVCLGQKEVTAMNTTTKKVETFGTINCQKAGVCTAALLIEIEKALKFMQSNILSQKGMVGLLFKVPNVILKDIESVNNEVAQIFTKFGDVVEMVQAMEEGLTSAQKKN